MKIAVLLPLMAILALSACGHDDPDRSASAVAAAAPSTATTVTGGTINGVVTKGPVNAATVCAYRIDNAATNRKGGQLVGTMASGAALPGGCTVTAADGTYSLVLPPGTTGDVLIESAGGTYCTNEAQYDAASLRCLGSGGSAVALTTNALRTVIAAPANGAVVSAITTPFSTAAIANAVAAGNLSTATFTSQFVALVNTVGLPSTVTSSTPLSDATLRAILAALSNVFGNEPTSLGQAFVNLAQGNYHYANGAFSTPAPAGPMPLAARIGASFKGTYVLACTNADKTTTRHTIAILADGTSTLDDLPVTGATQLGNIGIAVRNGSTVNLAGVLSAPRTTYQVSASQLDGATNARQFIVTFNADGSIDDTSINGDVVVIGSVITQCAAVSGRSSPSGFDSAAASGGFALSQALTCTASNTLGGSPSPASPKGASSFAIGSDGTYTLGNLKIAPADYTGLAQSGFFQAVDNLTFGLSVAANTLNVTTGTSTSKQVIAVGINRSGRANTLTFANGYGSGYDTGTCTP